MSHAPDERWERADGLATNHGALLSTISGHIIRLKQTTLTHDDVRLSLLSWHKSLYFALKTWRQNLEAKGSFLGLADLEDPVTTGPAQLAMQSALNEIDELFEVDVMFLDNTDASVSQAYEVATKTVSEKLSVLQENVAELASPALRSWPTLLDIGDLRPAIASVRDANEVATSGVKRIVPGLIVADEFR